jgi:hypothetical protein
MECKQVIIEMLEELNNKDEVYYITTSKSYTVNELIDEINRGTDLGLDWASELLRIARDLLMKVNRGKE